MEFHFSSTLLCWIFKASIFFNTKIYEVPSYSLKKPLKFTLLNKWEFYTIASVEINRKWVPSGKANMLKSYPCFSYHKHPSYSTLEIDLYWVTGTQHTEGQCKTISSHSFKRQIVFWSQTITIKCLYLASMFSRVI